MTNAIDNARKAYDDYLERYNDYRISMVPGEHMMAVALRDLLDSLTEEKRVRSEPYTRRSPLTKIVTLGQYREIPETRYVTSWEKVS